MAGNESLVSLFVLAGMCTVVMIVVFTQVLHQHTSTDGMAVSLFTGDHGIVVSGRTSTEDDVLPTTQSPEYISDSDASSESPRGRYNVLFMMTDDMRAQIGALQRPGEPLNKPYVSTPNLDKLASQSLFLKRAYVQFSLCGPSRTSILTGRRPDTTRIFDNRNYWRKFGGNFTTIPQYFKEHGYRSIGIGKIFHRGISSGDNDPMSWSEEFVSPKHTESHYLDGKTGWKAVTTSEENSVPLMDSTAVDHAIDYIKGFKSSSKPFFLALGFKKPHSFYVCPKRFFDHYPLESEEEFLSDLSGQPVTVKKQRNQNISISDDGQVQIPHDVLRQLRRGYFACISYVDYLVGRVMESLEESGLAENTIVAFMADHGYHFGENAAFGKQSIHETATHVPLIIRVPGRTDSGVATNAVVEGVDVFPTLAEAAGLPTLPRCPRDSKNIETCTQGRSLLPLIDKPDHLIKPAALSQVAATLGYMRYTIRTPNYRYVEWAKVSRKDTRNGAYKVIQMNPYGTDTELYDHRTDSDESNNVAKSSRYSRLKKKLSDRLRAIVMAE